ncbi:ParA family protein [Vibrio sp. PNB22_3_1]
MMNQPLIERLKERSLNAMTRIQARREDTQAKSAIAIEDKNLTVSQVVLNHCVSKQKMASLCQVNAQELERLEHDAIKDGEFEPAIFHKGAYQYSTSHISAMMNYLNKPSWRTEHECAVVTIQNQKGGTGKSMSTINIATRMALSHQEQIRVAVLDLDPQGSLRLFTECEPNFDIDEETELLTSVDLALGGIEENPKYEELVDSGLSHEEIVHAALLDTHIHNLKLIPAFPMDERFSSIAWQNGLNEGNLDSLKLIKERVIDVIKDDFDVILIDIGPHTNPLSWACLHSATSLLIPVTPRKIDWQSTSQFLDSLPLQLANLPDNGKNLKDVRVLITNRDMDNGKDDAIVKEIKDDLGDMVMTNFIVRSSAFEEAARHNRTVYDIRKRDQLCSGLQLDRAKHSVNNVYQELRDFISTNHKKGTV